MEKTNVAAAAQAPRGGSENRMSSVPMKKLLWKLGLPMIVSMVLQAVYNIVDTIFIYNMGEDGTYGGLALGFAFPVQIIMIAVGVGTGIGINALISKRLGEGNQEEASRVVGNGIFLTICLFAVFCLFGIFGSEAFIRFMASEYQNESYYEKVVTMGTNYLTIVCTLSIGSIGFAVAERFLQSTGKTNLSTIAQIVGAASNIILDPIFIYDWGFGLGVEGAAWATIIGQIASLAVALLFHYLKNKEIDKSPKYIKPSAGVIKGVYAVGFSAMIIQALPSVMMTCMLKILALSEDHAFVLASAFNLYYKIYQFPLFALFGMSNTIITILSFNYGMNDKQRVKQCIFWGILDSVIVAGVMIVIFEAFAGPLAYLFGIASGEGSAEIQEAVALAMRIAAAGYLFMAFSVAVQGVLQAFRYSLLPLLLVLCRMIVFILPVTYLLILTADPVRNIWFGWIISEFLASIVAAFMLRHAYRKKVSPMAESAKKSGAHLIVTVSREHGSNGRYIGSLVAQKLGIGYYDKELAAKVAQEHGLVSRTEGALSDGEFIRNMYLTTATDSEAIIAQAKVIKEIADNESCVIVGRAADFILREYQNVVKVFIYADADFKIQTVKEAYGDDDLSARRHVERADAARRDYYHFISGMAWGDMSHYDLCVNSSIGAEQTADLIVRYIREHRPAEAPSSSSSPSSPAPAEA